jgi:hypothetical protein
VVSNKQETNVSSARRGLMLIAQVAGLFATAWLVWSVAVLPRLSEQPLADIVGSALLHTLFACGSGAAITLVLYLAIARSIRRDAVLLALRTSATAVWFAPAAILLTALSPAAIGAALVLVVSATRLLHDQWRQFRPPDAAPFTPVASLLFGPPPQSFRFFDLIPALIAAFALELAALVVPLGYPLLAAALFCLGLAMLTLLLLMSGSAQPTPAANLPRAILGVLLTVILAAGLTVGGLMRGFAESYERAPFGSKKRPGPAQTVRALMRKLARREELRGPSEKATRLYTPPAESVDVTDKSFPGIVLIPETEPPKALVAPQPRSLLALRTADLPKPSDIPFTGEYWMFKPPNVRPPQTSYLRKGTPLVLSFVTTDHRPLSMEAHQKLDHAIDLRCCSGIQIAITNIDRYPGTVTLEIVLIDSAAQQSESLGIAEVTSKPGGRPWTGSRFPVLETLEFRIPSSTELREFNEIKVVFHRTSLRMDRSARISIERFLLMPRTG